MNASISVRELIRRTGEQFSQANLFFGHGTDNALDEAFYLIMTAARLDFDCPETLLDAPLDMECLEKINTLIDMRIAQRIPVAYLVNKAWFAGYEFYVDERVLIPRSPMAELIDAQFAPWLNPGRVKSILDMGTGSGCIAIACAHRFPDARVDAVDIDSDAIQIALKNRSGHGLVQRLDIIESDLFEQLGGRQYDLIISNPPYIGEREMQTLPAEYLHEPGHALQTDHDGLAVVDRLLRQCVTYLKDDGVLLVEVGSSMASLIRRYPTLPFIWPEFEQGGEGVFLLGKADLFDAFEHN